MPGKHPGSKFDGARVSFQSRLLEMGGQSPKTEPGEAHMLTSLMRNQCDTRRAGAPHVLVVDDYRGAAIATATYLSLDGMEARVAGGCGDALEIIKNWFPAVVLLDIWMPQRDGFETAEQSNIVLRLQVARPQNADLR
jgi:PleD family two-component response regulator